MNEVVASWNVYYRLSNKYNILQSNEKGSLKDVLFKGQALGDRSQGLLQV